MRSGGGRSRTRISVLGSAQQVRPRGSSTGGTRGRSGGRLLSRVFHSWWRRTLSYLGIIIIVIVRARGREGTSNRAASTSIRDERGTNMRTSQPPPTRARRVCNNNNDIPSPPSRSPPHSSPPSTRYVYNNIIM